MGSMQSSGEASIRRVSHPVKRVREQSELSTTERGCTLCGYSLPTAAVRKIELTMPGLGNAHFMSYGSILPCAAVGLSLLEWGTLLILAGMINFTLIGFLQFPIATFGLLRIPSYPLPIAIISALVLIGAVRFTQRPGAATLTILLLSLHTVSEGLSVPWAIRTAVAQQGLSYRIPGAIPSFNLTDALLPLVFIVSALIIDGVALWRLRRGHKLAG